ncbi:MAG: hypothetical protein ACFB9M_10565 [Myxococcota bacterium]
MIEIIFFIASISVPPVSSAPSAGSHLARPGEVASLAAANGETGDPDQRERTKETAEPTAFSALRAPSFPSVLTTPSFVPLKMPELSFPAFEVRLVPERLPAPLVAESRA